MDSAARNNARAAMSRVLALALKYLFVLISGVVMRLSAIKGVFYEIVTT